MDKGRTAALRGRVTTTEFKQNILRKLRGEGCKVTVASRQTRAEDVPRFKT